MFSGSSGDLGDQINAFFNTLNQLSTDPASLSLRQGVLTAAGNLATTFQGIASKLTQQRTDVDLSVGQAVEQVNRLTAEVAALNRQINGLENLGQDASAFIDQRTMLIRQLSDLIDLHTIQSDTGLALTTANGTALVAGQQSFNLETHLDPSGVQHIFAFSRRAPTSPRRSARAKLRASWRSGTRTFPACCRTWTRWRRALPRR
jgi:flagellar hook-associated protein 1 FlgK